MAEIKAAQVMQLRKKSGAGIMDAKKALVASDGDMDKAMDYLREKGIAKAAKKSDRVAAEGLADIAVNGNTAAIVELNSETDFVAKNSDFTTFVDYLTDKVLESDATTLEEALAIKDGEETINDKLIALVAKIGEKISFRRFEKVTKN